MIWYITDVLRHRSEREAIDELAARSNWLTVKTWRVDAQLRLTLKADIHVGERVYSVVLRYPNHFPHSPPVVLPDGDVERWSVHQWGAGGELCLEIGSDNWHPDYTGAEMLASAFNLLHGENPAPDQHEAVPSRHDTTLGQRLRALDSRLFVTETFREFLDVLPEGEVWSGTCSIAFHEEGPVKLVASLKKSDDTSWTDPAIPEQLVKENFERSVAVLRWPDAKDLPPKKSLSEFRTEFEREGYQLPPSAYWVITRGEDIKVFYCSTTEDKMYTVVPLSSPPRVNRLGDDHAVLKEKKVAIVGCGSIGSKIAVMLARSGVGSFFLVDDDILFPQNLVRHELNWREIATHKANSVARAIQFVNPSAQCEARRHRLGGQESSESVEILIGLLSKYDLIIDATAEPKVFNYLCASAKTGNKSMLWAEVYGGGIGGLIARHRPVLDPDPPSMRRTIEAWCAEFGKPAQRSSGRYETRQSSAPMIADDADVTVIAGHAARLAIDTLIGRTPSSFPNSVYMIGLRKGWIFEEPFDTKPIDVGAPGASSEVVVDEAIRDEEYARIAKLFADLPNEDSGSDENS